MASENDTVAEIGERMRKVDPTAFVVWWDQLAAAHKREISAKDAEVSELRECLKEAIREKCPFTRMSCKHDEPCDYECGTQKWRKALKGSNNATK